MLIGATDSPRDGKLVNADRGEAAQCCCAGESGDDFGLRVLDGGIQLVQVTIAERSDVLTVSVPWLPHISSSHSFFGASIGSTDVAIAMQDAILDAHVARDLEDLLHRHTLSLWNTGARARINRFPTTLLAFLRKPCSHRLGYHQCKIEPTAGYGPVRSSTISLVKLEKRFIPQSHSGRCACTGATQLGHRGGLQFRLPSL